MDERNMNMQPLTFERSDVLGRVVSVLRKGGVVALPTDTVYGLIADATNEKAVWKIFEIKGRPKEKALPVFVFGIEQARKYADLTRNHADFLKKVWPGGVTVVLRTTARTHAEIDADSRGKLSSFVVQNRTIAMRMPKDEFLQKVLREMGVPLAQSSANVSGRPAARSAEEVLRYFKDRKEQPEIVVQGGMVSGSPSTVVDLSGDEPKILREGVVSRDALSHFLRDSGFLGVVAL